MTVTLGGDPLANLDGRIKTSLQNYLKTPVEDRTKEQYMVLVTTLTRASMEYSRAMIRDRVNSQRQQQKMIGGKHL